MLGPRSTRGTTAVHGTIDRNLAWQVTGPQLTHAATRTIPNTIVPLLGTGLQNEKDLIVNSQTGMMVSSRCFPIKQVIFSFLKHAQVSQRLGFKPPTRYCFSGIPIVKLFNSNQYQLIELSESFQLVFIFIFIHRYIVQCLSDLDTWYPTNKFGYILPNCLLCLIVAKINKLFS